MARIFISIGSNINPSENVRCAVSVLRQYFSDIQVSPVYESEAVGFAGDNFLNLVVGASTDLEIHEVNTLLHTIEDEYGRDRSGPRFSSRTIDLDLLLYDDMVIKEDGLEIPREEITRNAFVLWPLADIAPNVVHPEKQQTIAELWAAFDKQSQALWPVDIDL
ncbi:MAG: 2-amino-4-hydroxy-6-hydroxymethyldihydropteridine diphosphokinase [Thioalkalispiraceae bacterium]|jgi:2-amino-4-hydroxy-6-hydroxymethyldihydropteridine diphosphokinase